jgi:hypothetical protein
MAIFMKKKISGPLIIIFLFILLSNFTIGANTLPDYENLNSNQRLKDSSYINFATYSDMKPGDILFQVSQYVITHCLLLKNYNPINEEFEFIEANSIHGVRNTILSKNSLNFLIHNKFARIRNVTSTQINNAILFAESQVGKKFELDMFIHDKNYIPNDLNDPNSYTWYCTELIWAAYYNCNNHPNSGIYGNGIDIDRNGWKKDCLIFSMVWPWDVIWDDDIELFFIRRNRIFENHIINEIKGLLGEFFIID